jgi:Uma2 family endonuclease
MADQSPPLTMTLEEFTARYAGKRYEFVDGRPLPMGPEEIAPNGERIVSPSKSEHGILTLEIGALVRNYVREHKLGKVYGAETGFLMRQSPRELRAADVAFISKEKLSEVAGSEWLPFPPDLAVEVVSEYDRASDLRVKIQSYLENGTRLLWVVYPDQRMIDVHRPGQPVISLSGEATLDGADVLPGFSAMVASIFAVID